MKPFAPTLGKHSLSIVGPPPRGCVHAWEVFESLDNRMTLTVDPLPRGARDLLQVSGFKSFWYMVCLIMLTVRVASSRLPPACARCCSTYSLRPVRHHTLRMPGQPSRDPVARPGLGRGRADAAPRLSHRRPRTAPRPRDPERARAPGSAAAAAATSRGRCGERANVPGQEPWESLRKQCPVTD